MPLLARLLAALVLAPQLALTADASGPLPAFCVSLPEAVGRRAMMRKLWAGVLDITFVDAVRGKTHGHEYVPSLERLPPSCYRENYTTPEGTPARWFGELGATISHLKTLEQAYATGAPWALIIEDDAVPDLLRFWPEGFLRDFVESLPPHWGIAQLALVGGRAMWKQQHDAWLCKGRPLFTNPAVHFWSGAGYFISRKTMRVVLERFRMPDGRYDLEKLPCFAIDVHILQNATSPCNYLVATPPLVTVANLSPSQIRVESKELEAGWEEAVSTTDLFQVSRGISLHWNADVFHERKLGVSGAESSACGVSAADLERGRWEGARPGRACVYAEEEHGVEAARSAVLRRRTYDLLGSAVRDGALDTLPLRAFATLYTGVTGGTTRANMHLYTGAVALFVASLRRALGTGVAIVVLVTADVSPADLLVFRGMGVRVQVVESLTSVAAGDDKVPNGWRSLNDHGFHRMLTKLALWSLVEFDQVAYYDADHVILAADVGGVFDACGEAALCATTDEWLNNHAFAPNEATGEVAFMRVPTRGYFNAGFLVLRPDLHQYHYLRAHASMADGQPFAEQDMLNELYKGEWKALDDRFNAWLEPAHKALPATVLDSAAAVHAKWWIVSRQLGGSSSAWNAVLKHAVESTGINLSIDVHV